VHADPFLRTEKETHIELFFDAEMGPSKLPVGSWPRPARFGGFFVMIEDEINWRSQD
jgi:hypothetical protein